MTGVTSLDRSKWDRSVVAAVLWHYRSRPFQNPVKTAIFWKFQMCMLYAVCCMLYAACCMLYAVRMKTVLKDRSMFSIELQHRLSHLKWTNRWRWESSLMTPCDPEMLLRAGRYPASVKSRIFYAAFLFRICAKRIAATSHKNAAKQRMKICVRQ
jgi:hypothetical protein